MGLRAAMACRVRRGCTALVVLGALLVAGCRDDGAGGADAAPEPTSTTTSVAAAGDEALEDEVPVPVDGVAATVEHSRLFLLDRAMEVGLRNVGDGERVVRTIRLDSPLFEPVPPTARDLVLRPGAPEQTMPLPFGAARCDDDTEARFTIVVTFADGHELRVDAAERNRGLLPRFHERECTAAAVAEQVDLRLGDDWRREGDTLVGELVLEQRQPGVRAALQGVDGSVVLVVLVAGDAPLLEVSDEQPRDVAELTVSAERCDPHALTESKKTFVFPAWLSVGGAEPVALELRPPAAAQPAFDELLESCVG